MFNGSIDKKQYVRQMEALKSVNDEYHALRQSDTYQLGLKSEKLIAMFHKGPVGFLRDAFRYARNKVHMKKLRSLVKPLDRGEFRGAEPDYFSDERIAVYTCVFGNYDTVQDPVSFPDNIDYYIITDQPVPEGSVWIKVDINRFADQIKGLTTVEQNRWFKMHPHIVFPNYRYSVYIDGNVVPVTDFTEHVNRIGITGIAMFWHSYNNCVYQEAYFNRYSVKKVSNDELDKHIQYLRQQGMPEDFGMTTCNVIARDHQSDICIKLMDDWWDEFMHHCRRDQLSFPYVIWKNGLKMEDIALLGNDVWKTGTLTVIDHN